jgi:hypothetical protein
LLQHETARVKLIVNMARGKWAKSSDDRDSERGSDIRSRGARAKRGRFRCQHPQREGEENPKEMAGAVHGSEGVCGKIPSPVL